MDKLASLVSKLDMKLDKWEAQYRPQVYKARNRGCGQRQDSYRSRDRSYSRDCGQYNYQGRRNYNNNNRNYRDNIRSRNRNSYEMGIGEMIVDQTIEERMDLITGKITEGIIIDKIMGTKGTEIKV